NEYSGTRQRRILQVQTEVATAITQERLDPMAIGLGYTEIEQLRRQIRDEQIRLRDRVRAVLTSVQRTRLKTLEDAEKVQPVISDAQCLGLIETPPYYTSLGETIGFILPPGRYPFPGCYGGFIPGILNFGPDILPTPATVSTALRLFLDLATDQVNTITRLTSDFNESSARRQQRIAQVQSEVAAELSRDVLNPMAIGLGLTEIEQLQRQIRDEQVRLRDRVRAVLTDVQRTRLKTLEDAQKLQPLISDAQCLGLIDSPIFLGNVIPAERVSPIATLSPISVYPGCYAGIIPRITPIPLNP
ncbi:MAG: hypothetical protein ACRD8O_15970, partial [Bryobacteraceae bacterium]